MLIAPGRTPHALVQKIEVSGWDGWPHRLTSYVGWDEMETELRRMLDGMDSVAMEVSPRDSIPYVDNVPAGVVELVESVGPRVVSSVDLISGTAAQWGARGTELHHRAAEILARTARTAFELAARAAGLSPEADPGTADAFETAGEPTPETEHDLAEWIRARLRAEGLTEADTIVAVGPNAAKPHYEPLAEGSATLAAERVFMVDLWGRVAGEPEAVFADQTWMGYLGPEPPPDVTEAWDAVVAARDAAVDVIRANPAPPGRTRTARLATPWPRAATRTPSSTARGTASTANSTALGPRSTASRCATTGGSCRGSDSRSNPASISRDGSGTAPRSMSTCAKTGRR